MNILVLAEKKKKVQPILDALKRKGHSTYLRLSKIVLVSKKNRTQIKAYGNELEEYDSVFIHARTSLAPFVEPLLEELTKIGCYTNIKKGSYYAGWNEIYLMVALAQAKIPTPKTISTGSAKNVEIISSKISYPAIVKTYLGKKVQHVLLVNSSKELKLFAKSLKTEIDGFMVREFINGDVLSCAVIGKKIFAVKRKCAEEAKEIFEGKMYKLSEKDEELVLNTAKATGYDIARIDLVKGKIIKVEPIIPIEEFNIACSEQLEVHIADYLIQKAIEHEANKIIPYDFLGIRKFLSKTILAPIFRKWIKF